MDRARESLHAVDPAPRTTSRTLDEQAGFCFGCGPANPEGLHLVFTVANAPDGTVTAEAQVELTRVHEGPPGYVHGGIIATLMDEAMSKLNRPLNVLAMTRHLAVDYLRPVPLHAPLTLRSRHLRRDGRKLFHAAQIFGPGDTLLAEAAGFFLVIDPALLAAHRRSGA